MALTAKFVTDFSAFYDAFNKAQVSLESFNTSAEHVGTTLTDMVTKFSGKNILEQGAAISRLFQTVDDTAILTNKELKGLGGTVDEIIEKMERMGVAVPDQLRMVSAEAKNVGESTGVMSDAWSVFTGTFGALSAQRLIDTLVSFGKEILADADHLTKLSDRTGIATDDLQDFESAGADAGVSIDTMANAINTLQQRVATGDKNAIWALKELGIAVEDFKTMSGGDAFRTIINDLHDMDDATTRTRVSSELFGKSWKDVAPLVKQGIDDTGESFGKMSTQTVAALDAAGDAAGRFYAAAKAQLGEALADVLTLSLSKTRELQSEFDKLRGNAERKVEHPFLESTALIPPGLPADLAAIEKAFDADADAIKRTAAASTDWKRANEEMLPVGQSIYATIDTIDGAVVEAIKSYAEMGVSLKTLGDWYMLTDTQIKAVTASIKEQDEIMKGLAKVEHGPEPPVAGSMFGPASTTELGFVKAYQRGFDDIKKMSQNVTDEMMRHTMTDTEFKIAKIHEWAAAQKKGFDGATTQVADFSAAVDAEAQRQIAALTGVDDIVTLIGRSAADVEAQRQSAARQTGDVYTDEMRRQQNAFMEFKGVVVAGTQQITDMSQAVAYQMTRTMQTASDVIDRNWAIQQAQRDRGEIFLTGMSGARFPIQARQHGGPVAANEGYLVGETGPELFVPATPGAIVPSGGMGTGAGGAAVVNNFYINGSIEDLARPLVQTLTRAMQQSRQWPSA